MTPKIILYYLFTPLADPKAIMLWQQTLAASLNLSGRIIISKDGLNGTLGGPTDDLKSYIKQTKQFEPFKKIVFKWSEGAGQDFPKLSVRVRDEIVTFNAVKELKVDAKGVIGGGQKLKPKQLHALVEKRGDDVVFFDGRSLHEAKVGRFKEAVTPNVRTAKDFIPLLDSGTYDELKDKAVVTYCTGGIRCEILSSLMLKRGFKEVYQLDGGIVKYGQTYGDTGLWEGSLFVFDGRLGVKFSNAAIDIGECASCGLPTSRYVNCANKACNELILICGKCSDVTYCTECANVYML